MSNRKKNIWFRNLIKLVFLIAVIIVVGLLGKLISFFNEGAEDVEIFNQLTGEKSIHTPYYDWELKNKGVALDPYTQKNIELAYSNAWYFLNGAISDKTDTGLKDYFTKNLLKEIDLHLLKNSQYKIQQVDLSHKLTTGLFSYDRQLITFKDQAWVKRKLTHENGKASILQDQLLNYEVVMILEDGFWKVKELLKANEVRKEENIEPSIPKELPLDISGINYYPSQFPWSDFWVNYEDKTTIDDFKNVKSLGLNTVRLFIPYEGFGGPYVQDSSLNKLESLLKVAQQLDLKVIPTLFDFPPGYDYKNYPSTRRHAKEIFQKFKSHPSILAWDIKNEADLDFKNYGKETVLEWLSLIIETAQEMEVEQPLTIGWSDAKYVSLLQDKLDFVSFHYFKSANDFSATIDQIANQVLDKQIVLSEYGKTSYSSAYIPFGSTDYQQAQYAQEIKLIWKQKGMTHQCYWTLNDYSQIPSGAFGWKPWIKKAQQNFGVFDVNSKPKLVANSFVNPQQRIKRPITDRITPFIFTLLCLLLFLLICFALLSSRGGRIRKRLIGWIPKK